MLTEPSKAEPPNRKRRWFQFSLRTLLIGVTLVAVPCAYVGWQAKIVSERKTMREWMALNGGWVVTDTRPDKQPPLIRRWLGDEPIAVIVFQHPIKPPNEQAVRAMFPEATPSFADAGAN